MSVYVEVGKNNIVQRIHRAPFDPTYGLQSSKDELEKTGYFLEEKDVPEPVMIEGKRAIAKFNSDTKKVYYDYENIPLSDKERLDMLEGVMNEILMNGMPESVVNNNG